MLIAAVGVCCAGLELDPNSSLEDGTTALIIAAENGHAQFVELMLEAGADPNVRLRCGHTALRWPACLCLVFVSNCVRSTTPRLSEWRCRRQAAMKDGTTAAFMAAQEGHDDVIILLLQAGAKPDLKRKDGFSPLLISSIEGQTMVVQVLVKAGADANQVTGDGSSALLLASQTGFTEVVITLLRAGADPNVARTDGATPLLAALHEDFEDIAMLLMQGGAKEHGKERTTQFA